MICTIQAQPAAPGLAIGRAVVVAASRVDARHYRIRPEQVAAELARARAARDAAIEELRQLRQNLPPNVPGELDALLDVHLMLLQDPSVAHSICQYIRAHLYNAEWALAAQLESLTRQFDAMPDAYLRERKADLEQLSARVLRHMQGLPMPLCPAPPPADTGDGGHATILVAHDISPADMLLLRQRAFAGFVTTAGGCTSHTAIVARSMGLPAVVGGGAAAQRIRQDDWLIVDGDAGLVLVNPPAATLEAYRARERQQRSARAHLSRLRHTPTCTLDGARIELLANIEHPQDCTAAVRAGAVGVGLFRSEFLFMGRAGHMPDEDEQYRAYRQALDGMQGLPLTIRTLDVGADKPLCAAAHVHRSNPALGLRGIRASLAAPAHFRAQLRAILRAGAHGPVRMLFPMLTHPCEIAPTLAQVRLAQQELQARGIVPWPVPLGAMIEVPAAALAARHFLRHFDFLSIGTNDLIQYTLAVDRNDETVAPLYDPLHPGMLRLLAEVIAQAQAHGKSASVCGEMAGDVRMTHLLLGLGLRCFSMPAAHLLAVKQQILRADTRTLAPWVQQVLHGEYPPADWPPPAPGGSGAS